ncbi:hypothetical protein BRADI_2g00511v3 [Brachypodium distachyon]|uniref:Reverse transcriptase zinc-binding domain-containing protein n=1 Tax=Brachypodium distachyon TaxID=15368 RepID=A0A0Q3FVT0_BRADI|nr:hypothetical protein BRADI_2g00511v3 [Brachypodium distachyon]
MTLKTGDDNHCVLCQLRVLEDWQHLFFSCVFSRRIWAFLQIDWCSGPSIDVVVQRTVISFGHPFLFEVVAFACWHIWKQRNGPIFADVAPSFRSWRVAFVHDLSLLKHRFKPGLVTRFTAWLDSLLYDTCNSTVGLVGFNKLL